jgi:hypothetical protein
VIFHSTGVVILSKYSSLGVEIWVVQYVAMVSVLRVCHSINVTREQ